MVTGLRRIRLLALALACAELAACGDNLADKTQGELAAPDAAADVEDAQVPEQVTDLSCTPVVTSDNLPARTAAMSERGGGGGGSAAVTTEQLFQAFKGRCGNCHSSGSNSGNFAIPLASNFATTFDSVVLSYIQSNDPDKVMPPIDSPEGKLYQDRAADDPVRKFAELTQAWIAAGKPADAFFPPAEATPVGVGFTLPRRVGLALTNLGNCIPSPDLVGTETQESQKLDDMFAGLKSSDELPDRLEATDLVSLDSAVLASHGVIGFAPAYTLWADNAKKMRAVRVPRGKSIEFDAATQSFKIPDNTRFYKTFMREVVDHRGNKSYRKVETRLIVARADIEKEGCDPEPQALFGTYVWNEAETEAVLNKDRLRNGSGFRDRLITYITDEQKADELIAEGPENIQAALADAHLSRHYGLPGSERCNHCHMGSGSKSFILGFTPLQINRRPLDQGGVIEPAERDELNQLQRLISYGVITGIDPAHLDQVNLLENSQGDRKPRNDYELRAQGYMVGNCAHCHNPRGYPSRLARELRDGLIFAPSAEDGHGIFQFPLDKVSPRIRRGSKLDHSIPYLSPSLYDLAGQGYSYKLHDELTKNPDHTVDAPWRSLIYRNVDAPFSYSADFAIFPHMPMDTPGYDCRARRILGSWMVSIPAKFKYGALGCVDASVNPNRNTIDHHLGETEVIIRTSDKEWTYGEAVGGTRLTSDELDAIEHDPQQYAEVKPSDSDFLVENLRAQGRVKQFTISSRYNDCQDPSVDMVDPDILAGKRVTPSSVQAWPLRDADGKPMIEAAPDAGVDAGTYYATYDFGSPNDIELGTTGMPSHSHWSETDLTETTSKWEPRRSDWQDPVVDKKKSAWTGHDDDTWEYSAIDLLEKLPKVADYRTFATTDLPVTHWLAKPECDLSAQPKDSTFTGAQRMRWMGAEGSSDTPVYMQSPGAFVFGQVCSSCHGPKADSKGRQAATIADMTAGETRVANLRDGLLGPPGAAGGNIARIFDVGSGVAAEDWAARYVVWMGLGGTTRTIPAPVLGLVFNNNVFGEPRGGGTTIAATDANMLTVPRKLCQNLLDASEGLTSSGFTLSGDPNSDAVWGVRDPYAHGSAKDVLLSTSGDREMWERICSFQNLKPLIVVEPVYGKDEAKNLIVSSLKVNFAPRESYGSTRAVGDPRRVDASGQPLNGISAGIHDDNPEPWCIVNPTGAQADALNAYLAALDASKAPLCPPELQPGTTAMLNYDLPSVAENPDQKTGRASMEIWSIRGAMNAGLAVYLYLEALTHGKPAAVPYDHCEELNVTDTGAEVMCGP
ncbi:MAG: hypothetical protein QM778_10740 [Myxococcales bacterium]